MRIAVLQLRVDLAESRETRVSRVVDRLHGLAGADLVVLPELWTTGFFAFDRYAPEAEPLHGATVTAIGEAASRIGAFVHAGSFVERAPDGRLHNTSILVSPEGEVVHTYRKAHLFGYRSREKELLSAGEAAETYAAPFGVVAMTTCYDLRFPEQYRVLLDGGAEVMLVSAAWPASRVEHWRLLTRARALENQALVVACNAVGTQNAVVLGGHSTVVDSAGEVLDEAGTGEEVRTVEVDVGSVAENRAEFPWSADRRFRVEGSPL